MGNLLLINFHSHYNGFCKRFGVLLPHCKWHKHIAMSNKRACVEECERYLKGMRHQQGTAQLRRNCMSAIWTRRLLSKDFGTDIKTYLAVIG